MIKLIVPAGLLVFMFSCTTINIKESDVFDVKRTIHTESFDGMPYHLEETRIKTSDSIELESWFIDNPKANKTVLYFGGNGFVMATSYHIITSILEQNVNLLVFNYRGYGRNKGVPGIEGMKNDALAAYDYLVNNKDMDADSIILHGHSMGTFLATYTASQRKSKALVLESPITDLNDWTETAVPWFLRLFLKFEAESALLKNSNLREIKKMDIPLLLISGKDDNITPPQLAEKLYHASASQKKHLLIIEEGGHNDLPEMEIYGQALNRFYNNPKKLKRLSNPFIDPSSVL
ncbi:MAG: alpha/beta hydrolase [Bacteroidota bacterium]